MKIYYIIFGFVFTLIGVLILVAVFDGNQPIKENIFFENTERDSLSEMKSKLKEYFEDIKDYEFYDVGETDTIDELRETYYPSDFNLVTKISDKRDINFANVPVGWFVHTLDELSSMSVSCFNYTEGEQCKHTFSKEWVEYHMEGDEMYINFYRRYKSSFLQERDEIVNIEYYLNRVDGKVQMIVGINSYNLLTDTDSEVTYHFLQDSYLTMYHRHGYTVEHYNYETEEYFYYNNNGYELEVHHYNPDSNVLIHYVDSNEDEWEYHLFEEEHSIFFFNSKQSFIRYDLEFVDGWEKLEAIGGDYYELYVDGSSLPHTVLVSPLGETPFLFLNLHDLDLNQDTIELSVIDLTFERDASMMLLDIALFETNLTDLIQKFGIPTDTQELETFFTEMMLNQDDSYMIP